MHRQCRCRNLITRRRRKERRNNTCPTVTCSNKIDGFDSVPDTSELGVRLPVLLLDFSHPLGNSILAESHVLRLPRFVVKAWLCRSVVSVFSVFPYWILDTTDQ